MRQQAISTARSSIAGGSIGACGARAGGQGWSTDYPGADNNFSIRLAELTRVPVKWDPDRQPIHVVVRSNDPLLYRCPMLFMEDVGTIQFSAAEVENASGLSAEGWISLGGRLLGQRRLGPVGSEIARVLPPAEYPIFDVPLSHPIMHTVYDVTDFLQVSSINFWYRSGGRCPSAALTARRCTTAASRIRAGG